MAAERAGYMYVLWRALVLCYLLLNTCTQISTTTCCSQWRVQDFMKEDAWVSAKNFMATPILITTPTNFDAATPIIGCALLRIVHTLHCFTIDDELASNFEA